MSEASASAIENLPALITAIKDLLSTTAGTIVVSIAVIAFLLFKVFHLPAFQAFMGRKELRTKVLQDYLSSTPTDTITKDVAAEMRNAAVFEAATGIYAEGKWRSGLVTLHNKHPDTTWYQMRRAYRYMDMRPDGTVFVRKFTPWDRMERFFNIAMMAVFLFSGAILITAALVLKASPAEVTASIVAGVLAFGMAMWSLAQNLPMTAARKVGR